VALVVAAMPIEYARLQQICASGDCEHPHLTTASLGELQALGLSSGFFATYFTTLSLCFVVVWLAAGAIIFWRKSDDWAALFVALFLVTFGSTFPLNPANLAAARPIWWLPSALIGFLGAAAVGLFLYLFPTGRFVPGWARWPAIGWIALQFPIFFLPDSPLNSDRWPQAISLTLNLIVFSAMLAAQIYRYRRVSTPRQRQQTRWLLFSFGLAIVILLALGFVNISLSPPGILAELIASTALYAAFLFIPISIVIAILRHRLWEIDILINRALVYGTLTVSVAGLYALVVGYLGALFQTSGNLLISLVATGLVAVLFQPLREWLQRRVNRLTYGERDEPYRAIARLGRRLEATLAPDAVLTTIVQSVAEALRLPYAAIALATNDDRRPTTSSPYQIVAEYSSETRRQGNQVTEMPLQSGITFSPPHLVTLSLVYQGEQIGQLILAPRTGETEFSTADRRLLEDLARQAGVAAHTVRLTADLQRSRERLVTAREEERRRLRRDLHDGLGPALAAQTLKVGAARVLYRRDPAAAEQLMGELERDIAAALADIRRLVYNLRPPALDELGLCAAIRECAAQYQSNDAGHLRVTVEAPERLPNLPAAVEVAAYRITQEALANVVRHAGAHACHIRMTPGELLELEIADDGVGLPTSRRLGVGLTSMRERAEELGGTCSVEAAPGGGTLVRARLPIP
jgi:signal transduction histidine kinase